MSESFCEMISNCTSVDWHACHILVRHSRQLLLSKSHRFCGREEMVLYQTVQVICVL